MSPTFSPTLAALQADHAALAVRAKAEGAALGHADAVRDFVGGAVAAGAALDAPEDRQAAQSLVNYWVSRAASEARKAGQAPPAVSGPEFDTLLAEFDPATLGRAIKDADARLQKSGADPALVRRLLLRLVRLRPAGAEFDPVPSSRAGLWGLAGNDKGAVDALVADLAAAGVVSVGRKGSPADDHVALRPGVLGTAWGRLSDATRYRLEFREKTAEYAQRAAAPVRWVARREAWVKGTLARLGRGLGRARRGVVGSFGHRPEVEQLDPLLQDDAEEFYDLNEAEVGLLRASRGLQRRLTDINRGLVGLVVAALVCAFSALGIAREQNRDAEARLRLSSLRVVIRGWADLAAARDETERTIAGQRWESIEKQRPLASALHPYLKLDELLKQSKEVQKQCDCVTDPSDDQVKSHTAEILRTLHGVTAELATRPGTRRALYAVRDTAFDMTLFAAGTIAAKLGDGRPYAEAEPYVNEFRKQYWGEMLLVEGGAVEQQMVAFLNAVEDSRRASHRPPPTGADADAVRAKGWAGRVDDLRRTIESERALPLPGTTVGP